MGFGFKGLPKCGYPFFNKRNNIFAKEKKYAILKDMKKYIKPKIKVVNLNPSQAVLQVCQLTGAYFMGGVSNCVKGYGGPPATCTIAVKGSLGLFGAGGMTTEVSTQNS